jgi:hypothetical protein
MSTPIANINPLTDTFENWLDKTNQIAYVLSNEAVTTSANSSGGYTEGNAHVQGILSANTIVVSNSLRGGNIQSSGLLNVSSDTLFSGANTDLQSNVFFYNAVTTVNSALMSVVGGNLNVTSNVNIKNNMIHIGTSGRLGVNTGNPTSTLSVFGSFDVSGSSSLGGNTSIFGMLTVQNTASFSNVSAANVFSDRITTNSISVSSLLYVEGATSLSDTLISTLTVASPLGIPSGGTGRSSLANNSLLVGNTSGPVSLIAPGSSGNLLVSNGTSWVPTNSFSHITSNAFTPGMIMMWGGSAASIPTGWALCDGLGGRPDLRDRFIVGAGSTYAVGDNGGSADATLPTHTHTATSTSVVTDPSHTHGLAFNATLPFDGGGGIPNSTFGGSVNRQTASNTTGITVATSTTNANTGTSGTNANLPPYYALALIIKL